MVNWFDPEQQYQEELRAREASQKRAIAAVVTATPPEVTQTLTTQPMDPWNRPGESNQRPAPLTSQPYDPWNQKVPAPGPTTVFDEAQELGPVRPERQGHNFYGAVELAIEQGKSPKALTMVAQKVLENERIEAKRLAVAERERAYRDIELNRLTQQREESAAAKELGLKDPHPRENVVVQPFPSIVGGGGSGLESGSPQVYDVEKAPDVGSDVPFLDLIRAIKGDLPNTPGYNRAVTNDVILALEAIAASGGAVKAAPSILKMLKPILSAPGSLGKTIKSLPGYIKLAGLVGGGTVTGIGLKQGYSAVRDVADDITEGLVTAAGIASPAIREAGSEAAGVISGAAGQFKDVLDKIAELQKTGIKLDLSPAVLDEFKKARETQPPKIELPEGTGLPTGISDAEAQLKTRLKAFDDDFAEKKRFVEDSIKARDAAKAKELLAELEERVRQQKRDQEEAKRLETERNRATKPSGGGRDEVADQPRGASPAAKPPVDKVPDPGKPPPVSPDPIVPPKDEPKAVTSVGGGGAAVGFAQPGVSQRKQQRKRRKKKNASNRK